MTSSSSTVANPASWRARTMSSAAARGDFAPLRDGRGRRAVEVDEAAVVVVAGEVGAADPQFAGEQGIGYGELARGVPPGPGRERPADPRLRIGGPAPGDPAPHHPLV